MTLSLFDEPDIFSCLPKGSWDRWYQTEAADKVFEAFDAGDRSTLVVMATGLGKTRVVSIVVNRWCAQKRGPILALCHRDELVMQMRAELERSTGAYVEVEQADFRASARADIVVGSTQSVAQETRLKRMGKGRFSLIIPDEAHHYVAPSFRRPLDFFEDAKVFGNTATPDRGDEKAMGQAFDSVCFTRDIEDGIDDGYLVPVLGECVTVSEIELENVGSTGGDFVAKQLDEAMLKAVEGVVQKTMERHPDRQAIAFFPGVRSAEYAMQRFNAADPGSTIFIDGETDREKRRDLVAAFKEGRYKRLCNCGIATEGFDAPAVSLIIQARPTKSRALYCQMCGRGTRPLPGIVDTYLLQEQNWERQDAIASSAKKNCVIMDFVGNSGAHSLVSLEDALGGKFTEDEVRRAKKKREKVGGDAMDARQALLEARRELLAMAKATKAKKVKATVSEFDPFKVFSLGVQEADRNAERYGAKPATEGQMELLRLKGFPETDIVGLSKRAANRLLDECTRRRLAGLVNYKQLRQLRRFGINDTDITWERASAAMVYLKAKGWGSRGTVDPTELRAIIDHQRAAGED